MRFLFVITVMFISFPVIAQEERDTTLSRCPVYITDTASSNNFFIEGRPVVLKVFRVKGKLTVKVEQRDQFFTLYFHEKRLKNTTYKIKKGSKGKGEVEGAYTFKSGEQTSFVPVLKGTIESVFDKEKNLWRLTVNGMIINQVERIITHYRVKAVLFIK